MPHAGRSAHATLKGASPSGARRGLWSFLTWSFFLSQVVTMEQASAAEAQAGGTGDEAGPASDPAAGQAARNAFLPVEAAMLADMQEAAPQVATQGLVQEATAQTAFLTSAPGEAAGAMVPDRADSSGARQTSAAPNAAMASQSLIAAAPDLDGAATPPSLEGPSGDDHLPAMGPSDGDPVIGPVLGIVGDVVGDVVQVVDAVLEQVIAPVLGGVADVLGDVVHALDPVLEQVVAPVLGGVADVLGDVVHALDPVLEQVVAPVLGGVADVLGDVVHVLDPVLEQVVAPVLGGVGDVLGDVVHALDPVLEQVVAPVLGGVGDVLGDVVHALDPVLEQVVAPVLGGVGDVLGDVVQVLDPVLEQVVAPALGIAGDVAGDVVQVLDPVVEQVAAPVADILGGPLASLLGLGSDGGAPIIVAAVVASSGSIDFEAGPTAGSLPLDDLFSAGGYSDYNLTLQADASVGANAASGGILPAIDIAAELSALTGNGPTESEHGAQGNAHHIGLPSLLGDTGLHWLGI